MGAVVVKFAPLTKTVFVGDHQSKLCTLSIQVDNKVVTYQWTNFSIGEGLCMLLMPRKANAIDFEIWRTRDLLESVIQEQLEC